jgi:hypothetical protein
MNPMSLYLILAPSRTLNLCFFNQTFLFPTLSIFSTFIQSLKNWDVVTLVEKNLGRTDHAIGTYNLGT